MTDRAVALVVDDSAVNRMLLSRHLERWASRSREAEDGRVGARGRSASAASDVAVVLLDVMMPEMDGYETLAAIKSDEALRHLPVIMISAVDELDSVARCIEMGAADYLPKPFNPVILAARVGPRSRTSASTTLRSRTQRPGRDARDDRAAEDRAEPLPLAEQVAALISSPKASSCWPVTAARPLLSSATCAASPRSATRPSRRSCWASCASTTRRWARSSWSTAARSSISQATA